MSATASLEGQAIKAATVDRGDDVHRRSRPAASAGVSGRTSMTRSWQSPAMGSHSRPAASCVAIWAPTPSNSPRISSKVDCELVRPEVGRVGVVERLEHAPDGTLEQLPGLRLTDELIVDAPVGLDEGLDGGLLIGIAPHAPAAQAEAGGEDALSADTASSSTVTMSSETPSLPAWSAGVVCVRVGCSWERTGLAVRR